ncbi:hypothetical protein T4B_3618 [Trichinella pseudospiralis]|uniref:Uncharacterized protein n=2 Tax=Trichinella pseudospiralis TaxID=6337 RepID=A0A0V1J0A9_TRIPS|nr:hypothetical protein T4D_16619 [Trichinella pseudospiralis]KRZ28425.1 hypothetical protein T4B_3618 [Trichinella pseudospiralis]KRZ43435.1 hypothetical protein T4C_13684 [Trichinella pseudospiralis]
MGNCGEARLPGVFLWAMNQSPRLNRRMSTQHLCCAKLNDDRHSEGTRKMEKKRLICAVKECRK